MIRQRGRKREGWPTPRLCTFWAVVGTAVLTIFVVACQSQPQPTAADQPSASVGKVMGDPAAPVEIVEWGDFQ